MSNVSSIFISVAGDDRRKRAKQNWRCTTSIQMVCNNEFYNTKMQKQS